MNKKQEYARLRKLGWPASSAWQTAEINARFAELEVAGFVRIVREPDDLSIEDLAGEGMTERQLKAFEKRVEYEGQWLYMAEYLDFADGWIHVGSIGGFIGDDFDDSGYDSDLKLSVIEAVKKLDVALCEGWV